MKRSILLFLPLALAACGKTNEAGPSGTASATSAASAASAAPAASASASAAPAASASAAPAKKESAWSVKYTLAAGTMYIPDSKDWSNTKFKNDPEKYLGDGTLTLKVEPTGKVTGTSEGAPLGDTIVDGQLFGDALTGTVRRKDPTDNGLTGTLAATVKGDALEGTMKLADTNAAVVREAKLSGSKGK